MKENNAKKVKMKPMSNPLSPKIFKALQNETRLAIYTCLTVYQKLTVKQLSDFLQKGKTTIHHHIRKLEEAKVVKWEEKKEDKKRFKTRYYFINYDNFQKIQLGTEVETEKLTDTEKREMKKSIIGLMKTETLVTTNLMNFMIKFIEEQLETIDLPTLINQRESYIKSLSLTNETLPIYEDLERETSEPVKKINLKHQNDEDIPPVTHIATHVFVPIKEVLEWRKKFKKV
ncbi:MAG: helix-turn-helix domain-containing protein [Candidatus Hodarchaeales archaeon]|jgi:DNA-binding transcriptional ArsR family regulator